MFQKGDYIIGINIYYGYTNYKMLLAKVISVSSDKFDMRIKPLIHIDNLVGGNFSVKNSNLYFKKIEFI
jgi:hypothetical protein